MFCGAFFLTLDGGLDAGGFLDRVLVAMPILAAIASAHRGLMEWCLYNAACVSKPFLQCPQNTFMLR